MALCNHFSHKVQASHVVNRGSVQFGFGSCEMYADAATLAFHVQASSAEELARIQFVLSDHVERFSGADALQVAWNTLEEPVIWE